MSLFITKIPVDVQAVTDLLPERSIVDSVSLSEDGKSVEIHWQNDCRLSPFTVETEWPLDILKDGMLPAKVLTKEEFDAKLEEQRAVNQQKLAGARPHAPILPQKPVDKPPGKADKKVK